MWSTRRDFRFWLLANQIFFFSFLSFPQLHFTVILSFAPPPPPYLISSKIPTFYEHGEVLTELGTCQSFIWSPSLWLLPARHHGVRYVCLNSLLHGWHAGIVSLVARSPFSAFHLRSETRSIVFWPTATTHSIQ